MKINDFGKISLSVIISSVSFVIILTLFSLISEKLLWYILRFVDFDYSWTGAVFRHERLFNILQRILAIAAVSFSVYFCGWISMKMLNSKKYFLASQICFLVIISSFCVFLPVYTHGVAWMKYFIPIYIGIFVGGIWDLSVNLKRYQEYVDGAGVKHCDKDDDYFF